MVLEKTHVISIIDDLLKRLFPISRSITGSGSLETLKIINELIPIDIRSYKSGDNVYDWVIPDEWSINDAWIKNIDGEKIIKYSDSNLHIVNYSKAVDLYLSFEDLKKKLHYHDNFSNAIPYRTTYYNDDWGFCITKEQYDRLSKIKGDLHVYIDSNFNSNGSMDIGELVIKGKSDKEFLISTYICHPSMANDNLSAVILTSLLSKYIIDKVQLNYTYRVIFVPETIGAIAYCAKNENIMKNIDAGLVVATVGGQGNLGYKQCFDKEHDLNYIVADVLRQYDNNFHTYPFDIHGSDERQYSSIGFRINTATITKDKYYEYDYYHTSLDNLDFVNAEQVYLSLECYIDVIDRVDHNIFFKSTNPDCEPMLSKHNLYPKTGAAQLPKNNKYNALDMHLWLLFYCDGSKNIEYISRKLGISEDLLYKEALVLEEKSLLYRIQ